ncbi:uncharacterized protein LOC113280510 [Papaver somniferum]|uniref:uncharacterized protein LOC113280510 n=1 Tax=Papaver somniferum TaxID=3469 RepID=UPI000E70453B|nr:uncharacterized protein LOC113280510 [Papaver somniferum]
MKNLGFSDAWCEMIMECISTVTTSILLNGAPGNIFNPTRGLRQGDPLSPYVFILCMEALSRSLNKIENDGLIHGFKVTKHCPAITHLFFADDCLIFIKARKKDARNLATIIEQFSKFSDQAVNFDKSALAFSFKVPPNMKIDLADILQIKRMSLQEKYLGVPLLLQKHKADSFVYLMECYSGRLAPWKSIFLAPSGKTILNQSVLGGMANHHLVVIPMPKTITDKMDSIQRNLWWENKKMLAWRMLEQPDAPWVKILEGICKSLEIVKKHYILEVGDGSKIKIWRDNWIPSFTGPPTSRFISSNPSHVNQLIDSSSKSWNLETLNILFDQNTINAITSITIPLYEKDKLRWKPASNGEFPVKYAKHFDDVRVNVSTTTLNILTEMGNKINFDAAFTKETGNYGYGLICRDISGNCNGLRGGAGKALDPEQAEAKALLRAVLWAKEQGKLSIHLEGDCNNMINVLNGNFSAIKWISANLIFDALVILRDFDFWQCSHVKRDANDLAYKIAKQAMSGVFYVSLSNMPVWIKTLIRKDKNNL